MYSSRPVTGYGWVGVPAPQGLCSLQPDPRMWLGLWGQVLLLLGCQLPEPWVSGRFPLHSLDLLPSYQRVARSLPRQVSCLPLGAASPSSSPQLAALLSAGHRPQPGTGKQV